MRRCLTLLLAAALAPGAAGAAPLADLRDCALTLHAFMDEPERLQPRFVPPRYRLLSWVPGKPYLAFWSFSCASTEPSGRPVQLSVAAAVVEHPDRPAGTQPPLELPNLWAHYVHRIHTDDAALTRRLRRLGFPARHAPGMDTRRHVALQLRPPVRGPAETATNVPGAWSSWTFPLIQHEPPHSHTNSFWIDGRRGTAVLDIAIPHAQDHFCELSLGERCGTIDAAPGTDTAEFLGAHRRSADAAVDHEPVARALLTVRRP